jgi:hypothetical protein
MFPGNFAKKLAPEADVVDSVYSELGAAQGIPKALLYVVEVAGCGCFFFLKKNFLLSSSEGTNRRTAPTMVCTRALLTPRSVLPRSLPLYVSI